MSQTRARLKALSVVSAACLLALGACTEEPASDPAASIVATDPLMARALGDPLMVDPDLAYRNEANAALTIGYDHPLPPLVASDDLANAAREAARMELLEDGPIPDLPFPVGDLAKADLSEARTASEILAAVAAPEACTQGLEDGLEWAVDLPDLSSVMPHGLVQQAAGKSGANCAVRVVRYLIPVGSEDVLQYHFAKADRARTYVTYFEEPEKVILGDGRTEQLVVHVRPGPGGTSEVDVIYWTK